MTSIGISLIEACVANAKLIFPIVRPEDCRSFAQGRLGRALPQMPQLPQPETSACRVITDQGYEFEERAAIIEYDGGLPRPLAEFLARRGREQ